MKLVLFEFENPVHFLIDMENSMSLSTLISCQSVKLALKMTTAQELFSYSASPGVLNQ